MILRRVGVGTEQDTFHSQMKATSRSLLPLSLTIQGRGEGELKRRQVAQERAQGSGVKIPYF